MGLAKEFLGYGIAYAFASACDNEDFLSHSEYRLDLAYNGAYFPKAMEHNESAKEGMY